MTLETALRQFPLWTRPAQINNDDSPPSGMKRKLIHWVGQKQPMEPDQDKGQKRSGRNPKKPELRDARELSSVTFSEVDDAYKYYAPQLIPSPHPTWITPNQFCLVHLKQHDERHPPVMFGRVKACYPSDGYIQNIQELALLLPNKKRAPDMIRVRAKDTLITPEKPAQSFCVRLNFLFSQEDIADFNGYENMFIREGLLPEFNARYIDLFDMNEHNQISSPWLYTIGSRWFASIPNSIQPEIREKLTKLLQWNKFIFNYHPERLPREIRTLNRELGFKAGFTDNFLIEPEDPQQTAYITSKIFDKLFNQPMKD